MQVEQGQAAVQQLNAEFGKNRTIFVKCDVTNPAELESMLIIINLTLKLPNII